MAAPHASSIAALILEIFPFYEQSDIEKIMKIAASGKRANQKRGFPQSGEDVLVSGFGKFGVKVKKERRGRNPATGEDLMLEQRKVVTFKCSHKLRDRISGDSG